MRFRSSISALLPALLASAAAAQSLTPYGTGTPGTGGKTPRLWATSAPRLGNTGYALTIDNGLPNAPVVGFIALRKAQFNLGGVDVWIDFAVSFQLPIATLDAQGSASYPLPLPNNASLLGANVFQQAFVGDAGGAPIGFSATQGVDALVTNFGVLIGTRSTGSASPQIAINLDTGTQSSFSYTSMTNVDIAGMFPRRGTHCLMGSGRSNKVALFDCETFPPTFVTEFNANSTPWACTWNPDATRAYIVNQAPATGTPDIQVVWGIPGAANFGQQYPGGNIPLGSTGDALRMMFTSDGNTGLLGVLGLFGGGGELRRYDTRVSSPTYHQQNGILKWSGEYMFDCCRVSDTVFAVATAGLGSQSMIRLVDVTTMTEIKTIGRIQFGAVIQGMVADQFGQWLYVGNSPSTTYSVPAGIVRIDVDKNSPGYGTTTNIAAGIQSNWQVYDVEISPAGDRIYAIVGTGIQSSFVGAINEYDTKTLGLLRTWSMNGNGNLYNLAIR